jgi:metal-responsive CopG/Arc/MetJ family transcriptional regulator
MKMALPREKFSSQLDKELLERARRVAESEGLQFQSLLEAALREYLERQETGKPRKAVIEAFAKSIAEFDLLYKELAK